MDRAVTGVVLVVLLTSSTVAATTTAGRNAVATDATSLAVDRANAEANVTSGAIRWTNQTLYFRADNPERDAGKTYAVRRIVDGDIGALLTEFVLDDGGGALLRTGDVAPGRYAIVDENGRPLRVNADGVSAGPATTANASWELFTQTLQVTTDTGPLLQGGNGSIKINSNRGRYELNVMSPDINVDALSGLLGGEPVDTGTDGVADAVRINATAMTTRSIRIPADAPAGTLNLRFAVPDTDTEDNVTVRVREEPRKTAEFDTLANQVSIGDTTTFTLQLERTRTATVWIGSRSRGYLTRLGVVDGNGDGQVTLRMNTYYAGRVSESSARVFGTDGRADRIVNVTRRTPRRESLLSTGEYIVNATVDGREVGTSTLVVTGRSKASLTMMTAPNRAPVGSVDAVRGVVTTHDRIAVGDKLVVRVETTGLSGFFNASYGLSQDSPDAREHGIHLTLAEQSASGSAQRLDITSADLVVTPDRSTIYAVFDTETLNVEAGKTYRAEFVVSDASPFLEPGEREQSNASFRVVESRAWFEDPENDTNRIRVVVEPAGEETLPEGGQLIGISGGSTVAPGTTLLVTLRSTSEPLVFRNRTVTVREDGGWLAEFRFNTSEDTGGLTLDRRYVLKVRHLSAVISNRVTLIPELQTETTTATTVPETQRGNFRNAATFVGLLVALGVVVGYLHWWVGGE